MNVLKGSALLTVIESFGFLFGVGAWFALARNDHAALGAILGTAIWTVFTFVEHAVALNLGAGRPPLTGLLP